MARPLTPAFVLSSCVLALTALVPIACERSAGSRLDGGTAPVLADREASLTIQPVVVAGTPLTPVAEVVGVMLERGGMSRLEIAETAFTPPEGADAAATAEAFASFVKGAPPDTEYALLCQFLGTPGTGLEEVRSIVVSKDGALRLLDRQTPQDADFARLAPKNPMDGAHLVASRLRPVFQLDDPFRAGASDGPLARRLRAQSGIPEQAELDAIEARGREWRRAAPSATIMVLRPHAPNGIETSAEDLARRIGEERVARFGALEPVDETPAIEPVGGMNEQRRLWSMARDLSAFVRHRAPDADYVLLADYVVGRTPQGALHVGGVHLALCDRAGQLVLVDFQNSRQKEFKAVDPHSIEACDALAARRFVKLAR